MSISRAATAHPIEHPQRRQSSELRRELGRLLPDLHGRALSLAHDRAFAQDIVQDAVERALRFEDQYLPGSNLRAWVHTIVFSVFVTRVRRLRRERHALSALSSDPCAWTFPEPSPAMPPLSAPLARAVASLPDPFREVVELVDLGDLSYKEAALALKVPLGTIMSRLHRGRRLLARMLEGDTHGPVPEAA